jgi:glycosyltransferase involved in cell wall biosynthesis
MLDELRHSRTIIDSLFEVNSELTTVWIGIYNGSQYLPQMLSSLKSQSDSSFQILIVDNASTDDSWELLQGWIDQFKGRIRLVRNEINVGATGSILLNKDLVLSEWFMFMHQDDLYLSNHVKTLRDTIKDLHNEVISISTSMGTLSLGGGKAPSPPRANWFIKDSDRPSQFLANVRLQLVPWPASAFRTEIFTKINIPWHSTAFPDTEITLRLCGYGRSLFLDKETMLYRENPLSESHSINDEERMLVAAASLARVFASNEFGAILTYVDKLDRQKFREGLKLSVQARVNDEQLQSFLWLVANESIAIAWDYGDEGNLQDLRQIYEKTGAKQVSDLLNSLTEMLNPIKYGDSEPRGSKRNEIPKLSGNDEGVSKKKLHSLKPNKASWAFYSVMYRFIPFKIRKFILTNLTKYRIRKNPMHPWNINWR